jgi:hypothetical protein
MGLSGMLVVLVFLRLEPTVHPTAWKIAVVEHLLKVTNQTHRRTQTRAPAHGALSDGTQMALRWHSDGTQMALRWHSDGTQMALRWHLKSDSLRLTQKHSEVLTSSMRSSIHSICTIWLVSIGVYLAFLLPSSKQSMSLAT